MSGRDTGENDDEREWEMGEETDGGEVSCSTRVRGSGCTALFESRTVRRIRW